MASKQLILETMTTLLTAYPPIQRTDEERRLLAALWVDVLADVPDELLQAAAREYTRSNATFAPAPGMLRTRAIELVQGDADELAARAWQGIQDCDYGRATQYAVDGLSLEIIRRLGGFEKLGNTPSEWVNRNFREPFLKMYADLKQRETASRGLLGTGAMNPQQKQLYDRFMKQLGAGNDNPNMAKQQTLTDTLATYDPRLVDSCA